MMKKVVFISLTCVFLLLFTACKKDYTCECSLTSGESQPQYTLALDNETKTKAISKCNDHMDQIQIEHSDIRCKLK